MKTFARRLRKESTDEERLLWSLLRGNRFAGFKFRRQVPIESYIVDFVCHEKKLVIELDGGQHGEVENIEKDRVRDEFLTSVGFRVLRFWNFEVKDRDMVEEAIWRAISEPPHP